MHICLLRVSDQVNMEKFWHRLSILITSESLFLGIFCFAPFLILESNSIAFQKTAIKISIYQYIAILFICCSSLFLFFYIIPKFIRKKHIKNTCQTLSSQILLLNENAKLRNDTNQLIQKLQQIANTTPELILKILRYYSTQSATNQQQSIFSLPQQAGIILDCLNKKSLKKIFKHMSKNEINLFQQLKLSLGTISTEEKFTTLSHFFDTLMEPTSKIEKQHFTENILPSQHVIKILKKENHFKPQSDIWKTLESIPSEKISNYLKTESSQTIAIILYNLSEEKAGEILNQLPKEISITSLIRLTALKSLSKKRIKHIEISLESYFLNITPRIIYYGKEKASSILSLMPTHHKNKLLLEIEKTSPKIAQQLSQQIICFDDLAFWNNTDICTLIKKTPEHILLLALLGANNKTREIFSKNISPNRWGKFLKQLNTPQPERIKDIDEAQYFIIKKAHVLINKKRKQG